MISGAGHVIEVTGDAVAGLQLFGLRRLLFAEVHAVGAAVVKGAARGRGGRIGHVALQPDADFFLRGVLFGNGGEKGLRVGVHGPAVHILRIAQLHDAAQIHDPPDC